MQSYHIKNRKKDFIHKNITAIKKHGFFYTLFVLLALAACEETTDCGNNQRNLIILGTQYLDTALSDTFKLQSIYEAREGIEYVDKDTSVINFTLPLNPKTDTVTYQLNFENQPEFLTATYSKKHELISPDCGPAVTYGGLEIVETSFDSINVVRRNFPRSNDPNIMVYQCNTTFSHKVNVVVRDTSGNSFFPLAIDQIISYSDDAEFETRTLQDTLEQFSLNMNPENDSTRFHFQYLHQDSLSDKNKGDTLTLAFDREEHDFNSVCDSTFIRYRNLRVVSSTFDSTRINEKRLGKLFNRNVTLFKTEANQDEQ